MLLFYFVLGSCFGSFVHVCAYRYGKDQLKHSQWSVCPACHHRLRFKEMVPCFSWLYLKGQCKWCSTKIPFHSFLCELLGGILSVLVFSCFDVRQRIAAFIIVFSLLYCSFTDYFYGLIPDRTHLLMIIGAFMMLKTGEYSSSVLFSVAVFIVFSFIALISKGMGFGDVKLISCLALVLSPYSLLVCIAIASCSAVISVLPIIIIRHLKKTVEIPFGPFLSISAIVCLFFLQ